MKQTLEQKRARHSWDKAREGVERHGSDYVNDAKGLPALIMNSGLMQVAAFLQQKGGRHVTLLNHLLEWLNQQCETPQAFSEFMNAMMEATPQQYRTVNAEAMAWLRWLRQMAPARAGGDE